MFNIESVESISGDSRVSGQKRPKASSVTRPFVVGVLSLDVERVGDLDLLLDLFLPGRVEVRGGDDESSGRN